MSRPSVLTIPTTVRILRTQANALKVKFPDLTIGALVRVLLTLFLNGQIPLAHRLALKEMNRAQEALKTNPKIAA